MDRLTTAFSLNEEAEYKRAAPRAEAIFKMHMANMAVWINFASSSFASYKHMVDTANQR